MGDLRKPQFSEEKRGFLIEDSVNGQSNEMEAYGPNTNTWPGEEV